jgi:hypothetical protein
MPTAEKSISVLCAIKEAVSYRE